MKRSRLFLVTSTALVLAGIAGTLMAWNPQTQWNRHIGSANSDRGEGVVVDATAVYVVGTTFGGTLPGQTSQGLSDPFLRKYDFDGTEVWTRQFGSPGRDSPASVALYGSALYATYCPNSDVVPFPQIPDRDAYDVALSKFEASGNQLWTIQFGTPQQDLCLAVAANHTGVYLVGLTDGVLPGETGSGYSDAFIRKYDFDGYAQWTDQFGATRGSNAQKVITHSSGIYVGGEAWGVLPGPNQSGSGRAYVRKYDASGTVLWTRQFLGEGRTSVSGLSADDGGVYVSGFTDGALPGHTNSGRYDAFVRKFDLSGNVLWDRQFGTPEDEYFVRVHADGTGIYVGFSSDGEIMGYPPDFVDAYLRHFDSDGNEIWTHPIAEEPEEDGIHGIASTDSAVYVTGVTRGALPGEVNLGGNDAFLVKVGPGETPVAPSVSLSSRFTCGETYPWVEDKQLTFEVTAEDTNTNDVVTLDAFEVFPGPPEEYVALPTGATMTPAVPLQDIAPVVSTFDWTPASVGSADGDHVLAFVATDSTGLKDECRITVQVNLDTDGDGLPDVWETSGYTAPNGEYVPLHQMGADPNKKDVFVDVDHMFGDAPNYFGNVMTFDHRPDCAALDEVKAAFAAAPVSNPDGTTGINLHIRVAQLPCDDGAVTHRLPFVPNLGSVDAITKEYLWVAPPGDDTPHFTDLKSLPGVFPEELGYAVHYCVFAHGIATGQTGISRGNGAGDFIVSLGLLVDLTNLEQPAGSVLRAPPEVQAGTFMHELGHNLGLDHGGGDAMRQKPNYLSIMNKDYFQMTGLLIGGAAGLIGGDHGAGVDRHYHFDYSREALPGFNDFVLQESALDENVGLAGSSGMAAYGTYYYTRGPEEKVTKMQVDDVNDPIAWDVFDTNTQASVAFDVSNYDGITDLAGHDDWANLVYTGGVLGGGVEIPLPVATPFDELSTDEAIEQVHAAVVVRKLKGHVAAKMLHLTWKPVGPGYTYNVYRSRSDGGPVQFWSTTTTEFKDKEVKAGVVYTYAVTAVDPVFEAEGPIAEAVSLQLRE